MVEVSKYVLTRHLYKNKTTKESKSKTGVLSYYRNLKTNINEFNQS